MSLLLLDTTVVSLLMVKPAEQPLLALYWGDLRGNEHAVSFQTYGELLEGAELADWGPRRRAAQQRVLGGMAVLYPDGKTVEAWALLRVHAQRAGRRLHDSDAWIAATALRWALPLITHDRDFVGLDVPGLQVVCHAL